MSDTGTSFFASANLTLPDGASFIAQPIWGSLGYALPAALGTSLAAPDRRQLVFLGDGAFQMTAQELGLATNSSGEIDQWVVLLIDYFPATSEVSLISTFFNPISPIVYEVSTIIDSGSPAGQTGVISVGSAIGTEPGHWIPEPSSFLLLATAALALLVARSRRRA